MTPQPNLPEVPPGSPNEGGPNRPELLSRLRQLWAGAAADGVPQRALVVALTVGTALNLINQGDALLTGSGVRWGRLGLTYMVPFLVSTHGALAAHRR
jgi:hypothetical protein